MKTIKIFLASSEELKDDRNAFGNLVRRLDKIYEKRGIRIDLFKWEDYDAAYNDRRKQAEYNDQVRASDMFLALFHTKAGNFTIEEFDVAIDEFKKHALPKVYTYCKDLQAGEVESPDLIAFKRRLFEDMGHYWCRYSNCDTMNLHFILQLEAFQNRLEDNQNKLVRVKEGKVIVGNTEFVNLDHVPFAALNKDYRRMKDELSDIEEKVVKARKLHYANPDDKLLEEVFNVAKNKLTDLAHELEKYQVYLFDIAFTFAKTTGEHYSKRLQKARELFETGRVYEADQILNLKEMKREVEYERKEYEQNRSNLEIKMLEIRLKAETIMTNIVLSIDERIAIACEAYEEAISIAFQIHDDNNLASFMLDYSHFCREYDICETAEKYYRETISVSKRLATWNYESPLVLELKACNGLVMLFQNKKMFKKAEEWIEHALVILHQLLEMEDNEVSYHRLAFLLNNLSVVHRNLHQFDKAKKELVEALRIHDEYRMQDDDAGFVLSLLANLILVCQETNQYIKAEEYVHRANQMVHQLLKKNSNINRYVCLGVLCAIGRSYVKQNRFLEAEEIYTEADCLFPESEYIEEHSAIIALIALKGDMSVLYLEMRSYENAIKYIEQSKLLLKKIKARNPFAAIDYEMAMLANSIKIYREKEDFSAISELSKELIALFNQLDGDQTETFLPQLAKMYVNQSVVLFDMNNYSEAKNLCLKGLDILRNLAESQPEVYKADVAQTLMGLSILLQESEPMSNQKDCERLYIEALDIYEELAPTAPDVYLPKVATVLYNLAVFHDRTQRQGLAIKELERQQCILMNFVDESGHSFAYVADLAKSFCLMGSIREWADEEQKAVECFEKSLYYYKIIDEACPSLYLQDILNILSKLGWVMEKRERYDEAIDYFRQIEDICQNNIQIGHQELFPTLACTLYNKGRLMSYMDYEYSCILSTMNESKRIYQNLNGNSSQSYEDEIIGIQEFLHLYSNKNN